MKKSSPWWPKLKLNFSSITIGLFLLTTLYLLYRNLGRDALFDWDEGIYAELGRQLTITKNLFVTYWNGSPWLEKPPGIAWVSGLGVLLAGPSALGARLLMPLFAVYTLYIVYRIGARLGNYRYGLIAAGVLASFNLFLGRTRAVNTDMPLLASITTTILFLLENRPAWWVALSVCGGIWFKGIAGIISLVVSLPLLLTKSKSYLLSTISYLLVFTLPWHLFVTLKIGNEFLTPYFFEQVLKRATAQIEFHFESRWYYFNYLYENLGLGVLLVAGVGAASLIKARKNLYLLWWVLAPLAIFTLAKTRLFWYILPIYPALALLVAQAIGQFSDRKSGKQVVTILAVGILCQGLLSAGRSVELAKTTATTPDRLVVASALSQISPADLAVLVPPSERLSEALLPEVAKLSSSFRYGGMPSAVFYYRGHINFYYDVDAFRAYWDSATEPLGMIAVEDRKLISEPIQIVVETPTYLGITKEVYALR